MALTLIFTFLLYSLKLEVYCIMKIQKKLITLDVGIKSLSLHNDFLYP